jgi:hypothetical protein
LRGHARNRRRDTRRDIERLLRIAGDTASTAELQVAHDGHEGQGEGGNEE